MSLQTEFTETQEKVKIQKRFVDYVNKRKDHEAALLGALGMSTRFIQARTGLTPCQISYRLSKGGIKRIATRNGEGPFARTLIQTAREQVDLKLMQHLEQQGVLYKHAA